jgi:hypothetical protein
MPWVARSGARIAFEHTLIAQWVLLTEGGENLLKMQLDSHAYRRRVGLVDGVGTSTRAIASTVVSLRGSKILMTERCRSGCGRRARCLQLAGRCGVPLAGGIYGRQLCRDAAI